MPKKPETRKPAPKVGSSKAPSPKSAAIRPGTPNGKPGAKPAAKAPPKPGTKAPAKAPVAKGAVKSTPPSSAKPHHKALAGKGASKSSAKTALKAAPKGAAKSSPKGKSVPASASAKAAKAASAALAAAKAAANAAAAKAAKEAAKAAARAAALKAAQEKSAEREAERQRLKTEKDAAREAAKVEKEAAKAAAKAAKEAARGEKKRKGPIDLSTAKSVAAVAAASQADSSGYVIINGRRVRMISTKGLPAPRKPKVVVEKEVERPEIQIATIKTKMPKKELDDFRTLLITKRRQLVGMLSGLEDEALRSNGGNLSNMPLHMADIGTDTFDQDFTLGMAATERLLLDEIDAALARIENRTYGVCQLTGKPIPKARLDAKPWAKYTVEAAKLMERGMAPR